MKKILGKILGADKAIEKTISFIDESILTKEEKVEAKIKLLKAYEPFKVAQRVLAIMFCSVYLYGILIGLHIYIIGVWVDGLQELASELFKMMNEAVGVIVLTIVGFYFAGGALEGVVRKAKSRINKK